MKRVEVALGIAKMAVEREEFAKAKDLLTRALPEFDSPEHFWRALSLADVIEENLVDELSQKLTEKFPDQTNALIEWRMNRFINLQDYSKAAIESRKSPYCAPLTQLLDCLASSLINREVQYDMVLARAISVSPDPSLALSLCCLHAIGQDRGLAAVELIVKTAKEREVNSQEIIILLQAAAQAVTHGTSTPLSTADAVAAVIRYLGSNPDDLETLDELVEFLAPEVAGVRGTAAVLTNVFEFANKTPRIGRSAPELPEPMTNEKFESVFPEMERAINWIADNNATPGQKLPEELVIQPVDEFVACVASLVTSEQLNVSSEQNLERLIVSLGLATAMASYTCDPNCDIELFRCAAAKAVLGGYVDIARNIIRRLLLIAGEQPIRRRKAWAAAADIFMRLKDVQMAMVASSCAFSILCDVSIEDAFLEQLTLLRILRDARLGDALKAQIEVARKLLTDNNALARGKRRLQELEIWIDFEELDDNSVDQERLDNLLDRCLELFEEARQIGDEILPVISIIAGIVQWCRTNSAVLNERTTQFLADIASLGYEETATTRLLTAQTVDIPALVNHLHSTQRARNSNDRAFDNKVAVHIARQLLQTETPLDVDSAAICLEALAERAIETGRTGFNFEGIPELLRSISQKQHVDVMLLGLDARSSLIRLTSTNGKLLPVVRESNDVFSRQRLNQWGETYPYAYKDPAHDDPNGPFFRTTEGMGISDALLGPTLLVMEPSLQRIPPNLLREGENLAGMMRPMASAPSLEWLIADMERTQSCSGAGAWILQSNTDTDALRILASGIEPILSEHNIPIINSTQTPYYRDLDLVIVGGHGSIDSVTNRFRQLSNSGEFRISPSYLARHINNVNVVVLFVCNGGRIDNQVFGHGTVSLAKQLLDSGVSAVMASPWPIEAADAAVWLPVFINELRKGANVLDANYQANMQIAKRTSYEARRCLALNLYGNPFTKCSSLIAKSNAKSTIA